MLGILHTDKGLDLTCSLGTRKYNNESKKEVFTPLLISLYRNWSNKNARVNLRLETLKNNIYKNIFNGVYKSRIQRAPYYNTILKARPNIGTKLNFQTHVPKSATSLQHSITYICIFNVV